LIVFTVNEIVFQNECVLNFVKNIKLILKRVINTDIKYCLI